MEMMSFLPFIGGIVPLGIGAYLLVKKGIQETSQLFFFCSLLSLGVFGVFEGLAYVTTSKSSASILLHISRTGALLSPFFFMSFSSEIRGKEKWYKIMAIPTLALTVLSWLFIIQDIHLESWGWRVEFNRPLATLVYLFVVLLMSIGLMELRATLKDLEEENSPFYHNLHMITMGFLLLLVAAISSNMLVGLEIKPEGSMPIFSFLQLFPTLIIAKAFIKR